MIRLSLSLAGLAICNAVLSVLMPWYIVTRLGIGIATDALFASGALPQLVFLVASLSLTQVLVPLLATESEDNIRKDGWSLFLGISGVFGVIAAILYVTAPVWVLLIVPGFSFEARQLAIALSRIQLLSIIGNAAIIVLWSVYYARLEFLWAELSSVIANSAGLLFVYWTLPRFGIVAGAWATVFTLGLKIVLLLPGLGRWERPQWNSRLMKQTWCRVKPFLLGQTYAKSDPLIDRFLTSLTVAGSLSLLYIGQQVYSSISLIVTKAISTPSVPRLAIAANASDWSGFRRIYRHRLVWMLLITTVGSLGLFTAGEPMMHLMIGHGGITTQNVHQLWRIMVALAGLLIGGASGQVITGSFYALGDTRTPSSIFIITHTVYIPFKIVVFLKYGVVGLAVITSIHVGINCLLQLLALERKVGTTKTPMQVV